MKQLRLTLSSGEYLLVELKNDQKWFINNNIVGYFIRVTDSHGRDVSITQMPLYSKRPKFFGQISGLKEPLKSEILEGIQK